MPEWFKDLAAQQPNPVAAEVAMLREEITALREAISPLSTLLVTGHQAIEEFKQISRELRHD